MDSICNINSRPRIYWIDVIKAICIFSVLYNHQLFSQNWIRIDYFFLVGFFFCSGITFNIDKGVKYRLVRIVDSLVIPYFMLSTLVFFLIMTNLSSLARGDFLVVIDWGKDIFMGQYAWFVPCLVSVECLYSFFLKLKMESFLVFGGALLFVIGFLDGLSLPWHIDTALYALLFFHIGYVLKNPLINEKSISEIRNSFLLFFGLVYFYASYTLFSEYPFYTSNNIFLKESLILVLNIAGIVLLLIVSKKVKPNKYLNYLGQNTLVLFFIHVPFVYYIYQALAQFINLKAPLFDNSIMGLIYVFIITLVLYPFVRLLNKCNVLTGKGRVIENIIYKKIKTPS